MDLRTTALVLAGRHHGVELDPVDLLRRNGHAAPDAAALAQWARDGGLWARAVRISWRELVRLPDSGPVVLLLRDGSAAIVSGASPSGKAVLLQDPSGRTSDPPTPVDELRLQEVWAGEAVLLRAKRGIDPEDAPFSLRWVGRLVLGERRSLLDVCYASFTLSLVTILPAVIVMTAVDKVLQHQSMSTLTLLVALLTILVVYETLLGHARRIIMVVVGTRLDTRMNLYMFARLLRLPLDYFERNPAGETMYRLQQIHQVREFLTGKLLATFLDLITLVVLLPFLFYMSATLATVVLGCAVAITLVIVAFLGPIRTAFTRVITAEARRSAALTETVIGIRTVKTLALEPQRSSLWDAMVADSAKWRVELARLASWPETIITPIERFMSIGVVLLGVYLALASDGSYAVGALFAFMMLAGRVGQPLAGMARLLRDFEECRMAVGQVGSVLNRPTEVEAASGGVRPRLEGALSFDAVTFTYAGSKSPALDGISFSVPAGTMLGLVGRSGSGKSTVTRLLQAVNRNYEGSIKLDGIDLRDINLRHLRTSLGVVLQENFLFRGSVYENIAASRPGLTLEDAVRAARLAGADEFIERMPNGYQTQVEEGSPNLSGGQRQRIAIARALITDPRLLILDEATSALDPESEALVNANLTQIARGRTMVIVSHRLSSLVPCDQILVLDRGRVVDLAPHDVLLERCMLYRQLWHQQNRHIEGSTPRSAVLPGQVINGD
jgi:ATP-binding cassette, subfamily B, bacterial HlyB/CyaB